MGKLKKGVKIEDLEKILKAKSSRARSSWRTRAKRLNIDDTDIPTSKEIYEWISQDNGLNCYITGTPISHNSMELDHRVPITRGGSFKLDNVGVTTRWYNNAKGAMTEEEFRSLLLLIMYWEDKGDSLIKRLVASNNIFKRRVKKK